MHTYVTRLTHTNMHHTNQAEGPAENDRDTDHIAPVSGQHCRVVGVDPLHFFYTGSHILLQRQYRAGVCMYVGRYVCTRDPVLFFILGVTLFYNVNIEQVCVCMYVYMYEVGMYVR